MIHEQKNANFLLTGSFKPDPADRRPPIRLSNNMRDTGSSKPKLLVDVTAFVRLFAARRTRRTRPEGRTGSHGGLSGLPVTSPGERLSAFTGTSHGEQTVNIRHSHPAEGSDHLVEGNHSENATCPRDISPGLDLSIDAQSGSQDTTEPVWSSPSTPLQYNIKPGESAETHFGPQQIYKLLVPLNVCCLVTFYVVI